MNKKLLFLLILLIFFKFASGSILSGIYSSINFSMRTSKEEEEPVDFEFSFELEKAGFLYIDVEREREVGRYYTNYEVWLTQGIKFPIRGKKVKLMELNAKTLNIEARDINIYHMDARATYYGYSLGIAQQWDEKIPETKMVAGKVFERDLDFLIIPARIEFRTDTLTRDFKKFDNETSARINFALLSWLSFRLKYVLKNYSSIDWQFKMGLVVNVG